MLTQMLGPFREFGFVAGLVYAFDRVLARVRSPLRLTFYELMIQPVAEAPVLTPALRNGIAVREIGPDDPSLSQIRFDNESVAERFAKPTVCFGAFRDDQLIAYMWLCLGPYEDAQERCILVPQPEERAIFDLDIFVFPEDRLGLGFVCLWDTANAYLRERGYRYCCSRVSRFNTMSRKSHKHFKWRRAGHNLFLNGKKFQLLVATVPPYLHVTFDGSSWPRIEIWAEPKAKP